MRGTQLRALALGAFVIMAAAGCDCGDGVARVTANIAVEPGELDFGTLVAGTRATRKLTVQNLSAGEASMQPAAIDGDARRAFSSAAMPDALSGGAFLALDVTYTAPAQEGADEGLLVVTAEGDEPKTLQVKLKGRSVAACPGGTTESACSGGSDDDCDGKVDCDDPDCAPASACEAPATCPAETGVFRITNDAAGSGMGHAIWDGTAFAHVWQSIEEPKWNWAFARVSPAGDVVTAPRDVTSSGRVAHPPVGLVWTGSDYAIAYSDTRGEKNEAWFSRFDRNGPVAGSDVLLSENTTWAFPATVGFNPVGRSFGAIWADGRAYPTDTSKADPYFANVSDGGQKSGAEKRIDIGHETRPDYAQLVWSDGQYGASWVDSPAGSNGLKTTFVRLSSTGTPVGDAIELVAMGAGNRIVLVSNGTGWAYAYARTSEKQIRLGRIDANGQRTGTETTVATTTDAFVASLAWNGQRYLVAWSESAANGKAQVFTRSVAADGTPQGTAGRVSCPVANGRTPTVAASGSAWYVGWSDDRDGGAGEIYAKILGDDAG